MKLVHYLYSNFKYRSITSTWEANNHQPVSRRYHHLCEVPNWSPEGIWTFSKASGRKLHLCELLPVHQSCIQSIPLKSTVKYEGKYTSKNPIEIENMKAWKVIYGCRSRLNAWALRHISLLCWIFLTKMESILMRIYPAYSLATPNRAIKR